MISGTGSNYGMVIVKLKPWAQRTGKGESQDAVLGNCMRKLQELKMHVLFSSEDQHFRGLVMLLVSKCSFRTRKEVQLMI